jgi:putative ABC transport system ATP-binding protein
MLYVKDMYCSYPGAKVDALLVQSFEALEGELCFIVGASGSGKSTLLESIGLMTNTLVKPPARFQVRLENGYLDLERFWHLNENQRSGIRQAHFSFIFQSANLFPHLTAQANMELPGLGVQMPNLSERVAALATDLLDGESTHKPATAYSGGQRQRIAFVRALAAPHSVLLADEPTGNLDGKRARKAMALLKSQTMNARKTSIIVSHDIDLALEFGDQFVILEKDFHRNSPGMLTTEQTWRKGEAGWSNGIRSVSEAELKAAALKSMENTPTT